MGGWEWQAGLPGEPPPQCLGQCLEWVTTTGLCLADPKWCSTPGQGRQVGVLWPPLEWSWPTGIWTEALDSTGQGDMLCMVE